MNVEERTSDELSTPEVRALVRTVFERTLERVRTQVDWVRVRVTKEGGGVVCHAQLHPIAGATVTSAETRPSMLDAILASADGLVEAMERREAGAPNRRRARRDG